MLKVILKMKLSSILMAIVAAAVAPAVARGQAGVRGTVWDASGAPVADVLVYLDWDGESPIEMPARRVIDQRHFRFIPAVLGLRVGDEIEFQNHDDEPHNVHSTSNAAPFNLRVPPGESVVVRRFNEPGDIVLLCDMHPEMRGDMKVFDHPYFTRTDGDGRFEMDSVPAGRRDLTVGYGRGRSMKESVVIPSSGTIEMNWTLPIEQPSPMEASWPAHMDPPVGAGFAAAVTGIEATLQHALHAARQGDVEQAKKLGSDAYFIHFEAGGLETAIRQNISGRRAFELEELFAETRNSLRDVAQGTAAPERAQAHIVSLVAEVSRDATSLMADSAPAGSGDATSTSRSWVPFVNAMLIILREGFEAILIVGAILAFLMRTGHQAAARAVYAGCAVALGASLLTAWAAMWLFKVWPAGTEVLEGVTILAAAAVLFYVSYWLISKVQSDQWNRFLMNKLGSSLTAGSRTAVVLMAFLAVYREGAETVLFYRALLSSTPSGAAVLGGFVVGCVGLVVLFLLVRLLAMQIPLKPFFGVTGVMLYAMGFIFAGQGIHELQEAGWLPMTILESAPRMPSIGLYPTRETLALQSVFVTLALAAATLTILRSRARTESQAG